MITSRRHPPLVLIGWLLVLLAGLGSRGQAHADGSRVEGPVSVKLASRPQLPRDLMGRPVVKLELVTVGGRWQSRESLRRVPLGQPLTEGYARAIMRELLATGRYASVQARALPWGRGALLRIDVEPRRIVTQVRVSGGPLDATDTLQAAGVEPGDDVTLRGLSAVDARVESMYRRAGFPRAAVSTQAIDTDEAMQVVLHVTIRPGEPQLLTERTLRFAPRPTLEARELADRYAVGVGERADAQALERADEALAQVFRERGYPDAEVSHDLAPLPRGARLEVRIEPGYRVRLRFSGNDHFDATQLAHALSELEDATPAALERRLRDFYEERGFLDVEIRFERRDDADGLVSDFVFHLRENARVSVRSRHFPCLSGERDRADLETEIDGVLSEALPGSSLLGPVNPNRLDQHLAPRRGAPRAAPLPLDPWTTYDPAAYERAFEHLRGLYRSEGYLSAEIGPVTVMRRACDPRSPAGRCEPVGRRLAPPIQCVTPDGEPATEASPSPSSCRPDPARGLRCEPEVDLYIPVRLGPRALLWDVSFEGNDTLVEADLLEISELELGSVVSQLALEEARRRIVERYAESGYAFAGVEVELELSPDRTRARARVVISERQPVTLSDVVVRGAQFTAANVILDRAALKPGDLYRRSAIRATEERLATLGTFTSVTVDLEDPEVPARRKVAIIRVQEKLPQYLDIRPGFSTGQGLRVAFEYGHHNLLSRAIRMVFRVQLGYLPPPLILDDAIRSRFQEVLDRESILFLLQRRNSATVELPEVGLGPLFRMSFEGLDLRDISRDFAIEKRAAIVTLSYRPGRSFNVALGAALELNQADLFADLAGLEAYLRDNPANTTLRTLLNIPGGLTLAASQRLGVTWDRRDNPVAATRGTLVSMNVEHVNAFELEERDSTFTSHFLQLTGRVAGYLSLSRGGMALATSLRWGVNQQLRSRSQTYPDRLFFLGGVDSLRGFPLWSLIPEDVAAERRRSGGELSTDDIPVRGGDVLINPRAELRIPVLGAWQTAIFVDTGNLWLASEEVFREFRLRYTAGAGVRFNTPVGPLAFDYGFNLARRTSEPTGAFHFSIGLF